MNLVKQRRLPRRTLLKSAGIAMALPWLDSMQPAFASEAKQPRRFLGVLNYFSFHAPFLFPESAGYDYTLSPYLELLQEHKHDFTIISGLNHPDVRDGHSSDKSFFTGAPHPGSPSFRNTISIDQLAAETIGRQTRYPSLNFSTSASYSCSYSRNGVAIPPQVSPAKAFAKLFTTGTPAQVAEEVMRVRLGLLLEVARLAMQVDLTRIVTIYFVGSSKTPSQPGASFAYHDLSHHGQNSDKIEQLAILERDLLRQWGDFLARMKETGDGSARLLDHTFAVAGAGMGNASSHDATNLPVIVAGGKFRHGQHLAHDPQNPPPLCNLWVTALQHLGLESEAFGSSSGTLNGLA